MKTIYLVQTLDTEDSFVGDPIPFTDAVTLVTHIETEYPDHELQEHVGWKGRQVYRHRLYGNERARMDVLVFTIGTY